MSLSEIFEGWKNHLLPASYLKETIESVSSQRMDICRDCPLNSINAAKLGYKTLRRDEHCTECGCTLSAKTKCLSCSCPLDKWKSVITPEEENTIERNETSVQSGETSSGGTPQSAD